MSLSAAELAFLADAGLTLSQVVEFAALRVDSPKVRTANAERQARYRDRMDVSPEVWAIIRARVFQRDGFVCQYCGGDCVSEPQCDHVLPLFLGGKSTDSNLVCACRFCNSSKAGRSLEEWLR